MVLRIDGLSEKSLLDAARRVDRYRQDFVKKNREFVRALTEAGIKVIYNNLNGAGDSEYPEPDEPRVIMGVHEGIMNATLRLRGEDVMFVEFGAGIHYNGPAGSSPHPKGLEFGYTIGSYGQGQGAQDHWWYKDDSGEQVVSFGTEATMPLYRADMEIRQRYAQIARSVFGG